MILWVKLPRKGESCLKCSTHVSQLENRLAHLKSAWSMSCYVSKRLIRHYYALSHCVSLADTDLLRAFCIKGEKKAIFPGTSNSASEGVGSVFLLLKYSVHHKKDAQPCSKCGFGPLMAHMTDIQIENNMTFRPWNPHSLTCLFLDSFVQSRSVLCLA